MKIFFSTLFLFMSAAAYGQDQSFYCSRHDTVGGMLKVDLTNGLVCNNGGAPRADFCVDEWAVAYPIVRASHGFIKIEDVDYSFTEYVGQSEFINHNYLVIRVYDHVLSSRTGGNGTEYVTSRSDLLGHLVNDYITLDPTATLIAGDPICTRILE